MNESIPVITVDGASGTGKGILSQLLAKHLGYRLLDSGALYRVLGLAAEKHGVQLENEPAMKILAENLDVQFVATESTSSPPRIILEGQDVTKAIRTEKIGNAASKAGALSSVREALLHRQRAFREAPGLVADGRDMGTIVFPDAQFKFFLIASPEERASRRFNQLNEIGINVNLERLIEELRERDLRDQQRSIAPLKPALDAILIDTNHLSIPQVLERVILEIKKERLSG